MLAPVEIRIARRVLVNQVKAHRAESRVKAAGTRDSEGVSLARRILKAILLGNLAKRSAREGNPMPSAPIVRKGSERGKASPLLGTARRTIPPSACLNTPIHFRLISRARPNSSKHWRTACRP